MVTKRSEYQRQFKISNLKKNLPCYYERLEFRNYCKNREYAHTPIEWPVVDQVLDTSSSENDSLSSSKENICRDLSRPRSKKKPATKNKHTQMDKEDSCSQTGPGKVDKCTNTEKDDADIRSEEEDERDVDRVRTQQRVEFRKAKLKQQSLFPSNKTYNVKHGCLKRPDRIKEIPNAKQIIRPSCAGISTESVRPPFVPYGWAEKAKHLTHNIRSSADLYPGALKAKQKQEEHFMQRVEERVRRCEEHKRRLDALFDRHNLRSGEKRDLNDWESEYTRNFLPYDTYEYAKAASARLASGSCMN